MIRICPKCESELGSYDHYFCTNCGEELPEELVLNKANYKQITYIKEAPKEKKDIRRYVNSTFSKLGFFPSKKMILGFLFVLILVGAGTIYMIRTRLKSADNSVPNITANNPVIIDKGVFGDEIIAEYSPGDVDVYIETSDFKLLGELFLEIDPGYYRLVQQLDTKMISHAGLFVRGMPTEPSMAVVLFPREDDFKLEEIDLTGFDWVSAEEFEGGIILSGDVGLITDSIHAKSGLIVNLTKNPKFVTYAQNDITEGNILVYTKSPEVKFLLSNLLGKSDSGKIKEVIEQINSSESNFIII